MKKITTVLIAIAAWQITQGQAVYQNNPFPKTITVTGSASSDIVPDEIFVNIELQEYQKKGESKQGIETIKQQFLEAAKSAGIPESSISISSYSGDNDYYSQKKRKKSETLNAGITYQVKFNNVATMDKLVDKLDDDATKSFQIVNTSHSKITEYRKQLKIEAIKQAKEKAIYLSESLGEKIGDAVTVYEPNEWGYAEQATFANKLVSNSYENVNESGPVSNVDFQKIRLRFEVTVVFALK